jgi:hypothetical protein
MLLPSVIKEQFLNFDELDKIESIILTNVEKWLDLTEIDNEEKIASHYYPWNFYSNKFSEIKDIISPKLKETFGKDFIISHSHILKSFEPYSVHTDFSQNKILHKKLVPAYTFIIPMHDYNSHTIVFEESSEIKDFDPSEWPTINKIDDATHDQYFSHFDRDHTKRLTIKEIFNWKKGSLHACDRRYYHCSDNYKKNGHDTKHAIIMWTEHLC